jgi:hypothetical protein
MTIGLGPQHHELVRQTIETYMHQVMQDFDPMFWDDELEYLLRTWAERDHYYLTEASIHRVFEWCYGCQEQAQEEQRQWARQQLAAQQVAAEQAAAQRAPADTAVIEPMSNVTTVEREEVVDEYPSASAAAAINDNAASHLNFTGEVIPEEMRTLPDGPTVVSQRQFKSIWHLYDEMVAQGYQPSILESAGVGVLRTLLPPSAPSTETVYSDGTTRLDLGGGPSSGDLAGQASMLLGGAQAAGRAATVVGKTGALAKEVLKDLGIELTGILGWLQILLRLKSAPRSPITRTGPRRVEPNRHNANIQIRDAEGSLQSHSRLVSGNQTPEEKALGFPKGMLASHTEARAVRNATLRPGDQMTITGQLPPCPACKGVMSQAARDNGAQIIYRWRENGVTLTWMANN